MERRIASRAAFVLMSALCLGLLFGGEHVQAGSIEKTQYGDLTDKEHCIRNYVLSYRDRDIARTDEVLHDDYVFCASDLKGDMSRKAELQQLKNMFDAFTIFGLDIQAGEWNPVSEFRGAKCEGCWETARGYVLVYSDLDKPAKIHVANSRFRVIVAPVTEQGATHYKIRAIEDSRQPDASETIEAPE